MRRLWIAFATVAVFVMLISIPTAIADGIAVGDIIPFGQYEQDNDLNNGKEPIEWMVLDIQDSKALLISKYGLRTAYFGSNYIWATSEIRQWLNGSFLTQAFTAKEQGSIITAMVDNSDNQNYRGYADSIHGSENTEDKIFLLSYAEAYLYFGRDAILARAAASEYARAQDSDAESVSSGYYTADNKVAGKWWLRTPGGRSDCAMYVTPEGSLTGYNYTSTWRNLVRPVLWLDLVSSGYASSNTGKAAVAVGNAETSSINNDGLILYLPFEGNANDAANHSSVTANGNISFAESPLGGQCAYFDGDGDYLDLGTGFNFKGDFTINVWVRSESSERSDAALFAKYESNGYGPYDFFLSNNRPAIWISNGRGNNLWGSSGYVEDVADTTIDNQWHMVTWTVEKGLRKYTTYVDGIELKSVTLNFDLTSNSDRVTIGRQALMFEPYDHLQYKGYMDEVRVYERCLGEDEILALLSSTQLK